MRSLSRLLLAVCLLVSCFVSRAPAALLIREFDFNRHERFANHPDFVGDGFDWSGLGRTSTAHWGTLISPSFMVTATHYKPDDGTAVRFYHSNDPNGSFEERNVVTSTALRMTGATWISDLSIVQLDAPVTNATFYPILDAPPAVGTELFVVGRSTGQDPILTGVRFGRNHIDDVLPGFTHPNLGAREGDVFIYGFDDMGGAGDDEARVQGGDSGAPSFAIVNGAPVVMGIHWFRFDPGDFPGLGYGSGDTLVSSFAAELDTVMANAGSSERVTLLAAVPEPNSLVLCGAITFFCLSSRRRR